MNTVQCFLWNEWPTADKQASRQTDTKPVTTDPEVRLAWPGGLHSGQVSEMSAMHRNAMQCGILACLRGSAELVWRQHFADAADDHDPSVINNGKGVRRARSGARALLCFHHAASLSDPHTLLYTTEHAHTQRRFCTSEFLTLYRRHRTVILRMTFWPNNIYGIKCLVSCCSYGRYVNVCACACSCVL